MNLFKEYLYPSLKRNQVEIGASQKLTGFYGLKGKNYKNQLMVIGRAVNGWSKKPFALSEVDSYDSISEQFEVKSNDNSGDQMRWLDTQWVHRGHGKSYNARRSAFWRVNQKILSGLGVTDAEDWYNSLYWTNLYKVAPFDGGNPSNQLIRAQQDACNKILKTEIEREQPNRILMLTAKDWANLFIEDSVEELSWPALEYVDFIGYWQASGKKIPLVVAKHPQGKKEELLANNVCTAFNHLEKHL